VSADSISRVGRISPAALGMAAAGLLLGTPTSGQAQSWSDFQVSRQVQAERELVVDVKYGAGRFFVTPARGPHLYQVRLRYDEDAFEPVHEYRDGRLRVGVEGSGSLRRSSLRRGDSEDEMELRLTREVPIRLTMELGAVRGEMDLGGVQLRSLDLATGASDAELRVSEPNRLEMDRAQIKVGAASFRARDLGHLNARAIQVEAGVGDVRLDLAGLGLRETDVQVSMGLGSVEIVVPTAAGVRLTRSTFLTSVNAPALTREGDAYFSRNWHDAERRVDIKVDAAFGSVTVRYADGGRGDEDR
jgi:hypothetical protein